MDLLDAEKMVDLNLLFVSGPYARLWIQQYPQWLDYFSNKLEPKTQHFPEMLNYFIEAQSKHETSDSESFKGAIRLCHAIV